MYFYGNRIFRYVNKGFNNKTQVKTWVLYNSKGTIDSNIDR